MSNAPHRHAQACMRQPLRCVCSTGTVTLPPTDTQRVGPTGVSKVDVRTVDVENLMPFSVEQRMARPLPNPTDTLPASPSG